MLMKIISASGFISSGIFSLGGALGSDPVLAAMGTTILLLSALLWKACDLVIAIEGNRL